MKDWNREFGSHANESVSWAFSFIGKPARESPPYRMVNYKVGDMIELTFDFKTKYIISVSDKNCNSHQKSYHSVKIQIIWIFALDMQQAIHWKIL